MSSGTPPLSTARRRFTWGHGMKWCHVKNSIRGRLNGTLARLDERLRWSFPQFRLRDAHMAARRCRETMRAYRALSSEADLALLAEEEAKQKCHRKPVEMIDNKLQFAASVALTPAQRAQIDKTPKARETREDYEAALAAFKAEFYAKKKRVARAERTEEQKAADCKSSEKRSKKAKEVQAERRREVGIGPLLPGSRVVDVEHAMPAPAPAPANASEAHPGPAAVPWPYLVALGMANK